ncbi:MAG: hypothetical protein KGS10_04305 [Chloroflexi bacterium]|nr:hypothetical protein [Chloroflexota bacterium]
MSYRCTLTLTAATAEELIDGDVFAPGDAAREAYLYAAEDGLEDLPIGWLEITVRRRVPNPAWTRIVEAKERSIEGQLAQVAPPNATNADGTPITDEQRGEVREMAIRPTVDALFFAAESKTPIWLTEEATVVVAPPERVAAAGAAWADIAGRLGLPAFGAGEGA